MAYRVHYDRSTAPRLGLVMNAIGVFSKRGKELGESRLVSLFEDLRKEGAIHPDSILTPRIFGPHEALKVADEFAAARVDVVMIGNSAFPNGHVFPTIALHPQLSRVPVIVTADSEPELGTSEWTTNAWCGVIMNNYVARQLEQRIRPLAGNPATESYRDELKLLLNAYRAVAMLRRDFLGRFGDAPGGFHSATMDQMTFLRTFGTRLDTVDLLGLMTTYTTSKAEGYCGESGFSENDVEATLAEMKTGRRCLISEEKLRKGARLYHAFKAQIEANGFTSIAVKCWPEMLHPDIDIAPCFAMTWLLTKLLVTAASCEADGPAAVLQSLGTLLSGRPAACLDFANYTGGCACIQLGHCGVGIAGQMSEDEAIAEKSPDRQGGDLNGPALIGQFEYGPKTGISIAPTAAGGFRVLCFTGENTPESNRKKLYSAADLVVAEYQQLHRLIMRHGFSHHLAVAMSDISREVEEVCAFLGLDYHNPKDSSL
jgi:L-fucose isomerase-like protein